MMAAHGEPRSLFVAQIVEIDSLETMMRAYELPEIRTLIRVDEGECLQRLQRVVDIGDLLRGDD